MTINQQKFVEAYRSDIQAIFALGAAGVGKTSLALSEAFREVLDPKSLYEKIIIIRSAVQGRQIGFTTGGVDEKAEPYEGPYIELTKELFKYDYPYENLKAVGLLEFRLSTFIRGLNFKNAIVIVDECQNMDYEELDTIYTRSSGITKVIFCGDGKQVDLQRYRQESGLNKFVSIFENMHKYEAAFNDYSNMIQPFINDIEYDYNPEVPDYAIINYTTSDCVRHSQVRKYLITKHNLGL